MVKNCTNSKRNLLLFEINVRVENKATEKKNILASHYSTFIPKFKKRKSQLIKGGLRPP